MDLYPWDLNLAPGATAVEVVALTGERRSHAYQDSTHVVSSRVRKRISPFPPRVFFFFFSAMVPTSDNPKPIHASLPAQPMRLCPCARP